MLVVEPAMPLPEGEDILPAKVFRIAEQYGHVPVI